MAAISTDYSNKDYIGYSKTTGYVFVLLFSCLSITMNMIFIVYLFLKKYKNKINDDFVLGYYIHLFTDYLWFKYFLTEIWTDDMITKLDGTVVKCEGRMALQYIYNDYTNLNINLIDDYNLDLKIFYNEIPEIENIITEIPMNKLFLIVDKAGEIIENTKVHKDMVFNMKNVHKFIETTIDLITDNLKELNVL